MEKTKYLKTTDNELLNEAIRECYNGEDVEITKELVTAWLDYQVDLHNIIKDASELRRFFVGAYDEEWSRGSVELSICDYTHEGTIHIGRGIDIIANALGVELLEEPFKENGSVKKYFHYKDYEVFQLFLVDADK